MNRFIKQKTGLMLRLIFFFMLIGTIPVFAQKKERQNLRSGNKHYGKEEYSDAETAYRKALEANPKSVKGYYNVGNSMYRQLKPEKNREVSEEEKKRITEAVDHYKTVAKLAENKQDKAMAWHNIGNIFMLTGNYEQSVDAYKNSLLNNPADNDTRYNYVLAKELLKNQQDQQQPQQNQEDKDQNQEQNKDQNQQQQNDQNKDQQQQNRQQQNQMSKENAEQILNAIKQQEQDTQEKRQQRQSQQSRKNPEKDW